MGDSSYYYYLGYEGKLGKLILEGLQTIWNCMKKVKSINSAWPDFLPKTFMCL